MCSCFKKSRHYGESFRGTDKVGLLKVLSTIWQNVSIGDQYILLVPAPCSSDKRMFVCCGGFLLFCEHEDPELFPHTFLSLKSISTRTELWSAFSPHDIVCMSSSPLPRSLSATTLSFAAVDSSTKPLDLLTSLDSPLFLFTLSRLPLTSSSHDTFPAGLGGRGGPVLRSVL